MLKSCIKLVGLALVMSAASSNVGHASVAPTVWQHPSNAHLSAILARNNLTNQAAPVEQFVAPCAAPGIAPVIAKVTPVQKVSAVVTEYAGIFRLVEKEAKRIGISPYAMMAIEIHETGYYRSSKWCNLNNPGGIEYRHFETVNCRRAGRWAAFDSPEDGIKAHAEVLSKPRYRAASGTNDPYQQVSCFAAGGYCEPGYNWAPQVKRHLSKLLGGAGAVAGETRTRHRKKKRVSELVD